MSEHNARELMRALYEIEDLREEIDNIGVKAFMAGFDAGEADAEGGNII